MMLMTTHAALPPEIYWKMMLPSTPMPKAVIELLSKKFKTLKYNFLLVSIYFSKFKDNTFANMINMY